MGKRYRRVTIEERCEIARLQAEGRSVRQIAADLDRSASTVARELKRDGSKSGGYQRVYADQRARARRWSGSRLERDAALRAKVLCGLKQGWSPEQVWVVWPRSVASGSYTTRASIGSSMDNWSGRRTTRGVTTCLAGNRRGAGGVAWEAVPLPSYTSDAPLPSVRRAPRTAALQVTGRPT